MHPTAKSIRALLLAAALLPALAAAAPPNPDPLRPTGPVTVTADSAEWTQGGAMVYSGRVALSSSTLQLRGDRLELRQFAGGQYEARVSGAPAHLEHSGETDKQGQPQPPVSADANLLVYDSRSGVVEITGKAVLTRGKNEIAGSTIRYSVAERRIQAAGGEDGQVRIVIQPPPAEAKAPEKTP